MHFLDTYALVSGAVVSQPFIKEETIEVPSRPYITFHPSHDKGTARQYDHWSHVIEILKQKSIQYEIIQIGEKNYKKYDVNVSLLGQTSYNSLAYVINNASLHLGYDSLPVHLASYYGTKIVALYPHWITSSGPYFSEPQDIKILQPDFSTIKPCYSYNDPHRLINTITPEEVATSVMNLL